MKIEKTTKQIIVVDGQPVLEQSPNGRWDIVSAYSRTPEQLRVLHAALGKLLTDLASSELMTPAEMLDDPRR